MPYFNWHGITLTGKAKKGKLFARTAQELDTLLFRRDIALLGHAQASPEWWSHAITDSVKISFFRHLAILLSSGVLLPDALSMVTEQLDNPRFQEVVYAIAHDVQQGRMLSEGMQKYPEIFDPLMIHIIQVGHQAGALAKAFDMLSDYLESVSLFKKKLRAAALMPALTLGFFGVIATVIFVGIMPRFKQLFDMARQPIPWVTHCLMGISDALCGWFGIAVAGVSILLLMGIRTCLKRAVGKRWFDRAVLQMPIVGELVRYTNLMMMLKSVALLVNAGMPLLFSLRTARVTVSNLQLQDYMQYLEYTVASGSSLSQAMGQHPEQIFEQTAVSMIKVGEESGQLSSMLYTVAQRYQEKSDRLLARCATLFQPLLMIILGIMTMALIFAVYIPIMSLANI